MKAKDETIVILNTLGSTEWLWLERFLSSPYHNTDERLLPLAQLLRAAPGFQLEEKTAYPLLFPGQAFVARNWGDLLRKFLRVLQAFILQQQLKKEPALTALAAVNSRNERDLYELTQGQIDHYDHCLRKQAMPLWEKANEYRRRWQKQYEIPGGVPDMAYTRKSIEYHRLQHCLLEIRYRIEEQIVDKDAYLAEPQQEQALLNLASDLQARWPILELYLQVYLALRAAPLERAALSRCEKLFYHFYPTLHLDDRKFFFAKLMVLFNRNMQKQHANCREDLFRFQQFGVAQGIYLEAGKMTETSFLNICMMGIAVAEFDWVVQFREQHLPRLASADNTNIRILSEALLEYGRGNYGKVYQIASQASRLPLDHRLRMYGIQIKAYTELYLADDQYANPLMDYLRATDRFLRYHQKVSQNTKTSILSLIKIIRRLVVLKERGERPAKIKERLEHLRTQSQNIAAGEWLREKIAQL